MILACALPHVIWVVSKSNLPDNSVWGTAIDEVRKRGDSCGGVVTCVVRRCPKGLGSPVFDKLEAELAKALMSLPATKASPLPVCLGVQVPQGPDAKCRKQIPENRVMRRSENAANCS